MKEIDFAESLYRTSFYNDKNERLVKTARANDVLGITKELFEHYSAQTELWDDEKLSTRYGMHRIEKDISKQASILDIGCGNCELIVDLQKKGCDVSGVDLSIVRVIRNRERVRKLYFGSSEHLPIEDESVDCCICIECLEHCIDAEKTLSEIKRVLKPGGILFLQVPNEYKIDCEWHLRIFSSSTLKELTSHYLEVKSVEIIPYLFGQRDNSIYVTAEKGI